GNREDSILVDFGESSLSYRREIPASNPEEQPTVLPPIKDKAPRELLILPPDGKLIVRDAFFDSKDRERETRLNKWRERIKTIEDREKERDRPRQGIEPGRNPLGG